MTKSKQTVRRGRPSIHGARMVVRSIGLPAEAWSALDDAAHAKRISTAELIRRRLGVTSKRAKEAG